MKTMGYLNKSIKFPFFIVSVLIAVLFNSCCHHADNRSVPYQIFPIDSSSKLYLYLCDEWGEKCILLLYENNRFYSTATATDAIPFIQEIKGDTIILAMDMFASQAPDTSVHQIVSPSHLSNLGGYSVLFEYHYNLHGEELDIDLGSGTQDYAQNVDRAIIRNDSVLFLYQGNTLLYKPQQEVFFHAHGNRAGQFCCCAIDSTSMIKKWHFFYPTEEVVGEYIHAQKMIEKFEDCVK